MIFNPTVEFNQGWRSSGILGKGGPMPGGGGAPQGKSLYDRCPSGLQLS